MLAQAEILAERLRGAREVKVVSHIDADGVTSAAVAARALDRLGIPHTIEYLKSLRPEDVERLKNENPETLWFTDLGAGAADRFGDMEPVISDHHVPTARGRYHLNCHFHGEDGARSLSGATTTYLVARALARENRDMAHVALVGAVGDLQDSDDGRLTGWNRVVIEDASAAGVIRPLIDTRYFGRETRPLFKLLQYADDPCVPGVTGREDCACEFLAAQDVPLKDGESWRRWTHLNHEEKRRVLSAVAKSLLERGYGHKSVRRLVGEVYVLPGESEGQPVRDAKEFATLLNSTARYGEAATGLAIALGDREEAYEKGLALLKGHRANLVAGIQLVKERGLEAREHLQWFHAGTAIRETIVGIVAGMLSNAEGVRRDLPVIGFAESAEGAIKVSGRAPRALVGAGLDLAEVMRLAAAEVGGAGGGHAPAAGATIPKGKESQFLEAAERVIERQLTRRR